MIQMIRRKMKQQNREDIWILFVGQIFIFLWQSFKGIFGELRLSALFTFSNDQDHPKVNLLVYLIFVGILFEIFQCPIRCNLCYDNCCGIVYQLVITYYIRSIVLILIFVIFVWECRWNYYSFTIRMSFDSDYLVWLARWLSMWHESWSAFLRMVLCVALNRSQNKVRFYRSIIVLVSVIWISA